MSNKLIFAFAFLLTWATSFSQIEISPVEQYGHVQAVGNRLIDEHGDEVQLRGMSFYWSQWQPGKYYTPEVVKWLKDDWKCSVLRAAMAVDEGGYLTDSIGQMAKVETVVQAAIDNGIYVIIDWHTHHADKYQDESVAFFSYMAQKYGAYDNVIYEPFNEPLAEANWDNDIKPYLDTVIAEIRKYDPDNLILAGNSSWSSRPDQAIANPIIDTNVAYVMHYYAASHGQNHRDKVQATLDAGLSVFVSEYGTAAADGGGSVDYAASEVWWDYLAEKSISWCNWSVADLSEATAALNRGASILGGWDLTELSESGLLVREKLREQYVAFSSDTMFQLVMVDDAVILKPDSTFQFKFQLLDNEGVFVTDSFGSLAFTLDGGVVNDTGLFVAGDVEGLYSINASVEYNGGVYSTKETFIVTDFDLTSWRDEMEIGELMALTFEDSYELRNNFIPPFSLDSLVVQLGDKVVSDEDTLVWRKIADEDDVWADSNDVMRAYFAMNLISPFEQTAFVKYSTGGYLKIWVNGKRVISSALDEEDVFSNAFILHPGENTIVISYKAQYRLNGFKFQFVQGVGEDLKYKSFNETSPLAYADNLDCNNLWLGDAYLDTCGLCAGGTSGRGECGVQLPFLGEPIKPLDTHVQCEDFDFGGEGYAYHDVNLDNNGGAYRNEAVDISTLGSDGNHVVGWTVEGEWLAYTVTVDETGYYYIKLKAGCGVSSGAYFHFEIDGAVVSESLYLENTGDWWDLSYKTLKTMSIPIDSGEHVIKIVMDSDDLNLDYFYLKVAPAKDCMGVLNGEAYRNVCGTCIAGTSGIDPSSEEAQCVSGLGDKVSAIAVHPNPSTGGFYVDVEDANTTYTIYDFSGTLIESGVISLDEQLGQSLNAGVYLLQIVGDNKTQFAKLIKE